MFQGIGPRRNGLHHGFSQDSSTTSSGLLPCFLLFVEGAFLFKCKPKCKPVFQWPVAVLDPVLPGAQNQSDILTLGVRMMIPLLAKPYKPAVPPFEGKPKGLFASTFPTLEFCMMVLLACQTVAE